ncbi:MAG: hypothetical protein WD513_03790 [Balneolaceae bacterium]
MSKQTKQIILWAFILHTGWEFGQCLFLYNMWDWPFINATIWMWGAVFGDILIVLALWKITATAVPSLNYLQPNGKSYLYLIVLSFAASIFLEWMAIALNLWEYSDAMPVVTVFDYEVGLSPIVQITLLPAASIYLADRFNIKWKK